MAYAPDNSARSLQLPEVLDLAAAAPLAKSLAEERGTDIVVDASQVQHLGAQCLQVLLAAASTWRAEGVALHIVNQSAAFLAALELVGVPAATFAK